MNHPACLPAYACRHFNGLLGGAEDLDALLPLLQAQDGDPEFRRALGERRDSKQVVQVQVSGVE